MCKPTLVFIFRPLVELNKNIRCSFNSSFSKNVMFNNFIFDEITELLESFYSKEPFYKISIEVNG